jgi:hypothetical protein
MPRIALTSLILLAALQTAHAERSADVGAAMTAAAQSFLASLNDEESAKTTMAFDDPARLDWHNIPKARKGLPLDAMSPEQKHRCHKLLEAALSDSGYDKVVKIMALENNLREGEKGRQGSPVRDPDLYYLTIFGKPDAKGTWGWSFEGHHLSLNFVIRDGRPISDSPSFWGANPATVKVFVEGGPEVGTRTLALEEQLAFDLINDLDEAQRAEALIAEKPPADYRAAGEPQPPHTPPAGLAASKMNTVQKQTLLSLLRAYNVHLELAIARERIAAIEAAGLDRVHFAWAGATQPGVGHYYRVQGPTFVLELVNIQSDPAGNPANHIHSVWRSLEGDFAVPAADAK